jgi:hypothetical protein
LVTHVRRAITVPRLRSCTRPAPGQARMAWGIEGGCKTTALEVANPADVRSFQM